MEEKFPAKGIPWIGAKRPPMRYRFWPLVKTDPGVLVASDRRAYARDRNGCLRALNKPMSRRDRHRAEVATRS